MRQVRMKFLFLMTLLRYLATLFSAVSFESVSDKIFVTTKMFVKFPVALAVPVIAVPVLMNYRIHVTWSDLLPGTAQYQAVLTDLTN